MRLFHEPKYCASKDHQEFWNKTKYGVKSAIKMDRVDLAKPDHLDSFENFLNTLSYSASQHSEFPVGLPSIISPKIQVTKDHWVVSMIQKSQHVYIVTESLGDSGIRMDWFDFIVNTKPHFHGFNSNKLNHFSFGFPGHPELMLNKRAVGMVRYCPTNNGNPLMNIPLDMTRAELFHKLNWNHDTHSWTVPVENAKNMLLSIRTDFDKCSAGTLKFKFCGHSAPRHAVAPEEVLANCKTWAVSKLKSANIDVEIDKHKPLNKIVAHKIAVNSRTLR